jgi:hypothetical protein
MKDASGTSGASPSNEAPSSSENQRLMEQDLTSHEPLTKFNL